MGARQLRNAAPDLAVLDSATVFVLVDNVSDGLSSVPDGVTNEMDNLMEAGAKSFSGEGFCFACFGISLVLTAKIEDQEHTVLFDGGPNGTAVEHNVPRLGIDMGSIEAVVLSHGHIDHAGGLPAAVSLIAAANDGRQVPVHVNPEMFCHRGERLDSGDIYPNDDIPSIDVLEQAGGQVENDPEPRLLLDDMFYLSGEIPRTTSYEKGIPVQVRRNSDDTDWEPDPWVMDERYMALNVRDKGIMVFTACSHAGLINVLRHARDTFSPTPLYGVMGGFHLAGKCHPPSGAAICFDSTIATPPIRGNSTCLGWVITPRLPVAPGTSGPGGIRITKYRGDQRIGVAHSQWPQY
jgi:7,8-dihydropterin-6-yl-methyl-4-(beta-D-ribofuranosyl)aminobenzene 5'-phosphate synthase